LAKKRLLNRTLGEEISKNLGGKTLTQKQNIKKRGAWGGDMGAGGAALSDGGLSKCKRGGDTMRKRPTGGQRVAW